MASSPSPSHASAACRRPGLIFWLRLAPVVLLSLAEAAAAQPTNAEVYLDLAATCLTAAPDTVDAFRLESPEAMPYLATGLAALWQADGYTVFLGDSAAVPPDLPRLAYTVDEAQVTYERVRRGRVQRTVTLALRYTLTATDGRLIRAAPCRETATDVIPLDALDAVESPAFPETQGERPPPRWPRRYLEPIVLTAATAVVAFLFFSLRSDRADDGV